MDGPGLKWCLVHSLASLRPFSFILWTVHFPHKSFNIREVHLLKDCPLSEGPSTFIQKTIDSITGSSTFHRKTVHVSSKDRSLYPGSVHFRDHLLSHFGPFTSPPTRRTVRILSSPSQKLFANCAFSISTMV